MVHRFSPQRTLPAILFAVLALAIPATASAATYDVNTADSGAGSLRDALTQINTSPDPAGDTINIPAGTITLGSALPTLDNAATNLTLTGAGARSSAISGADAYRIFNIADGTVIISGLTITHGNVSDGGAGLLQTGGTVTVNDTAFTHNADTASQGGAIYVDGSAAQLTLNRDLLDSNSAFNYGAGIDVDAGHATINTTTISHSTSRYDTAIDVDTPNGLTVNGATIVDNSASQGSGVVCCGTPDGGTFTNSIIARNSSGDTTTPANCTSETQSGGHNITDDSSCFASGGTDVVVSDVRLATALANNGGPTDTYALLPGSPAIDAGDNSPTACPSPDQRGVVRPIGVACDVGAYEFAPPVATTGDAGAASATGVTVNGAATPYGPASYHFEYGTTTSYGSTTASTDLPQGNSSVPVSANLSGLAPGTTYHYRLVVTNSDGTTTGEDKTFTTASAPTVTTGPATNVTQNTVTLTGKVDAHGVSTTYTFQYGISTNYGSQTTAVAVPAGSGAVTVTSSIQGLKAGQAYHYRLVAVNASGTTNGADATFKTKGRVTPRKVSVKARPTHDATFPYRYTFTGKVTFPKGVSKLLACRGRVSVQIKNGTKTISNRRARVSKSCKYSQRVTFKVRKRLQAGGGKLKVTVRFLGNAAAKPKKAKPIYVRYG